MRGLSHGGTIIQHTGEDLTMHQALWIIFLMATLSPLAMGDTFIKQSTTYRVGPFPTDLVAGDLNGDGIPEIVTTNRGYLADPTESIPASDQLSFLIATKNLEYVAQPQLRTGFGPYALVMANIDALKAKDLVVANFMASRNRDLTLLRNLGENRFEPLNFSVDDEALRYTQRRDGDGNPTFTMPGFTALAVEDFDGDGYRDVVLTGWSSDVLAYFPGVEEGYFADPILTPVSGSPRDIVIHDFNADGKKDLAIALYRSHEILLMQGEGGGRFTEVNRFTSHGALPVVLKLGDMNGDKKLDLVVGHRHKDDSVVIFYREKNFDFPVTQELVLGKDRKKIEYGIRDLHVGDYNDDGKLDLSIACATASQVYVLLNTHPKNAAIASFTQERYTFKKGTPHALCAADFNGDGQVDLGVALWDEFRVALLLNR